MEKTKLMEESMKKLDSEMKRSDELLAQMIPKAVADKVKSGASPVDTCEVFEQVTIVFNDIPDFGDICAKCDGMQIVVMLNNMFAIFDYLSDRNEVYKVETVKDSFVGVSGAPERNKNHAEKIMDMALDMRDCVAYVKDPRPEFDGQEDVHVKIRLGSHSGMVVAGIVGNKMPRYCLFGDAMNTSSRMMSFGDAQCIHISKYIIEFHRKKRTLTILFIFSATKELLPATYVTKERGKITVKGKGEMVTCWLESKSNRSVPSKQEVFEYIDKARQAQQERPQTAAPKSE